MYVSVAGRLPEGTGKAEGVRASSAGRAATHVLGQISELIESGDLRPVVGREFPLRQARQALQLSETRHGRDRILLLMHS